MYDRLRPLALVTGASSGIGYELARLCAEQGYDLVIAADEPGIVEAAEAFRRMGARVEALQLDLATAEAVDKLCDWATRERRPVDVLMANAGHGQGHAFLDQDWDGVAHVLDTNITGTLRLVHRIGRQMRDRGQGRILFTGSIAGLMPGTFTAVYNATKAFVDSFALALRNELKDTGVSVTCLMPGATDTGFFERAGLADTKMAHARMADPAKVARAGFEAMMQGEAEVIPGLANKVWAAATAVTPQTALAEMHRGIAAPGSADS